MTSSKHTIVYAEDDLDDLFLVKQAFEAHDHIQVIHVADGQKAVRLLEEMVQQHSLPCLVILDINMPVMNGWDALRSIRRHPKMSNLAVVMFTTSNNASDVAQAQALDATFITKPIDYKDLEGIARRFVDQCNFEINNLSLQ